MAAGAALGLLAPEWGKSLAVVAAIFLRLIRSLVGPLLVGVLVSALAGSGGLRKIGRLGVRAVIYFEIATTLALAIGWGLTMLMQPGHGVAMVVHEAAPAESTSAMKLVEQSTPQSIMEALARNDVLPIVIFCLLFGIAAATAAGSSSVVAWCDSLAAVMFQYTRYVMYAAPLGVFAAMAATLGENGVKVLVGLGRFGAAAWIAQGLYVAVVLVPALVLARAPLGRFWAAAREPFLVAFATTSSAAALPQAIEHMERYGVARRVIGLVMPLGLSFNAAGSTIHLAMATLFVAQAAGISLPVWKQLLILGTLKLTSKGVAGIPRANFVILTALFTQFGLPLEGLALLLGVDAAIDPIRTSVNILGHCVAPVVIERWDPGDAT